MNQLIRPNTRVMTVERMGNVDRYGQPELNTVATDFRGRLDRTLTRTTGVDGNTVTLDGTLMACRVQLEAGDLLTLENEEQWEVYNVDEAQDINGKPMFRMYGMTKLRKKRT